MRRWFLPPMSEPRAFADPERLDADEVLRELRLQIEAVKARVEEHRETMEAAGLTSTTARDAVRGDGG